MSIRDVVRAIKKVKPHIFEYQKNPPYSPENPSAPANFHETSTRYIIIDPILQALGWDLSDPSQCWAEYPIPNSGERPLRPDYLLLDEEGDPAVVIEAKRIDVHSEDDLNFEQLQDYIDHLPTVHIGVVSTGHYWAIFIDKGHGNFAREKDLPLGLHWDDEEDTARRLYHLAKERVQ